MLPGTSLAWLLFGRFLMFCYVGRLSLEIGVTIQESTPSTVLCTKILLIIIPGLKHVLLVDVCVPPCTLCYYLDRG